MIIKLESCLHEMVEGIRSFSIVNNKLFVTCVSCYRRFEIPVSNDPRNRSTWVPAQAPPPCPHEQKKPMQRALTNKRDYHDALCLDCGKVLRHPDGVGEWTDVRFYGYLIVEKPMLPV